MLSPDTVLQSRYRIVRQLGQGGMGTVYEAIDERFNSTVALKETFFQEEALRKAFEREANLLHRLRHPAVPRVTDHFTEDGGQFLVMEFISGKDLWQMSQERGGSFSPDKVLDWADQILAALEYLHSQQPPIVHRDIKPQNLKLTEEGRIILLDFGLAKGTFGFNTSLVTSRSVMGFTPNFAPLEQMQGTGTGPKSDLYSLAATLYYLSTGEVPTDALSRATAIMSEQADPLRPANEIDSKVSVEVAEILQRAMATNPAKRPDTAAEMREALQRANKIQTTTDNQIDLPSTIILPAPTKPAQEISIKSSLSKTQAIQLEYWTIFRNYLEQNNSFLSPSKPQAQTWFPIAIGRTHFRLEASTQRNGGKVCAYLILSGPDAKPHFYLLQRDKEAIHHEIGEPLEWSERPTREQCYVFLCKHKTDPENRQDWEAQHEWLKEKLELFHKVFAPRIKNLNASGYVYETKEETKPKIPPTVASPQPQQKLKELVSTISAPAPKVESHHQSTSPTQPSRKSKRLPPMLIGVGILMIVIVGLTLLIVANRMDDTTTSSPTPVIKLGGTKWQGARFIFGSDFIEVIYEFKQDGTVIETQLKSKGDFQKGTWTIVGNKVTMNFVPNASWAFRRIEARIEGERMYGTLYRDGVENTTNFDLRIVK